MDPLRIIAAIVLPPLGVFLQVGVTGHFWLNILLTLLGYVPGLVHAIYIIATRPSRDALPDRAHRVPVAAGRHEH